MDRKMDDSLQILPTCTSPKIQFSEESVNTWWCHLTEDGRLVNQNSPKEGHDVQHGSQASLETKRQFPDALKSPFSLKSNRTLLTGTKEFSPFDHSSDFSTRRKGYTPIQSSNGFSASQDITSGYQSPFLTTRRPPRLKIYPGALGSLSLRGLGQRYWETEMTCEIKVHLYGLPILEAGVAWGESADTSGLVEGSGNSWVLRLTTCYDHTENVCAKAVHGCRPLHHSPVRDCTKDDKFVVKYGFLLNFDTKELAVIDITQRQVWYVFQNIDTSRDLYPVFGVFSRHRHHVQVRLLAGRDLKLDSATTGLISKVINKTPEPKRAIPPSKFKYSMFMQAT